MIKNLNLDKIRDKIDLRDLRFRLEYALLLLMMGVFILLSAPRASHFGGWLGRHLGLFLTGANRRARKHLETALPGRSNAEYKDILKGMWDNLGRIVAEYPALDYCVDNLEIAGAENLRQALSDHGQAILFSGHIGNWEVMAAALLRYKVPVDLVYRAPNNPYVAKLLDHFRSMNGRLRLLPKSRTGTRQLVESVRSGRTIGILIDQKYNEGIEVPFFGHPAMTSPAFVQLSQKYSAPLVPFRVERLEGMNMRLSFYPVIETLNQDGAPRKAEDVIGEAHALLETWITERPDQWLWLHRRWK